MASTLLTTIRDIIQWFIDLLPTYSGLPSGITSAITTISGGMKGFECIVPVSTYQTQFAIIVAIAGALLGFRFFAWVFKWRVKS